MKGTDLRSKSRTAGVGCDPHHASRTACESPRSSSPTSSDSPRSHPSLKMTRVVLSPRSAPKWSRNSRSERPILVPPSARSIRRTHDGCSTAVDRTGALPGDLLDPCAEREHSSAPGGRLESVHEAEETALVLSHGPTHVPKDHELGAGGPSLPVTQLDPLSAVPEALAHGIPQVDRPAVRRDPPSAGEGGHLAAESTGAAAERSDLALPGAVGADGLSSGRSRCRCRSG